MRVGGNMLQWLIALLGSAVIHDRQNGGSERAPNAARLFVTCNKLW